jgi:glycosyltransferase involved in cell wall biosynthesis
MKDISIVIPFHNEAESLVELLPLLLQEVQKFNKTFEIILINDCSKDNSLEIANNFAKTHEIIKVIDMPYRGGQTGCYKEAFQVVDSHYTLRMDADLQDDPRDLYKFIEKIDEGADLIMGLREARKHSKLLRFASGVYDLLILLLTNSPLHSNSGSYVCFKTKYIKEIPFQKNDHRYLPLITMSRGAEQVSEVFVRHNSRQYGESKYKPMKKVIFGIPEVVCFAYRLKSNYYV